MKVGEARDLNIVCIHNVCLTCFSTSRLSENVYLEIQRALQFTDHQLLLWSSQRPRLTPDRRPYSHRNMIHRLLITFARSCLQHHCPRYQKKPKWTVAYWLVLLLDPQPCYFTSLCPSCVAHCEQSHTCSQYSASQYPSCTIPRELPIWISQGKARYWSIDRILYGARDFSIWLFPPKLQISNSQQAIKPQGKQTSLFCTSWHAICNKQKPEYWLLMACPQNLSKILMHDLQTHLLFQPHPWPLKNLSVLN